jgi:hypothetical protein
MSQNTCLVHRCCLRQKQYSVERSISVRVVGNMPCQKHVSVLLSNIINSTDINTESVAAIPIPIKQQSYSNRHYQKIPLRRAVLQEHTKLQRSDSLPTIVADYKRNAKSLMNLNETSTHRLFANQTATQIKYKCVTYNCHFMIIL